MDEQRAELRHHSRFKVSWPVFVRSARGDFRMETVDVSVVGAKVRPAGPLEAGTMAVLNFRPPRQTSTDIRAMVWRSDPDGVVFFFMGGRVADLPLPTDSQ
jgi:hypothetical protein